MSVPYYGDFPVGHTSVVIPFNAFTSNDPSASATITDFANTDVHIHKNGSLTQRSSAAGIAIDIDVDGITGGHWITIDLSDNTDAGFYAAGGEYSVRIEGVTIDGATINAFVGAFSIERTGGVLALLKGGTVKVDIETIKTRAVTCGAAVTVRADVGHAGIPGAENGAPYVAAGGVKLAQTVDLTASQEIAADITKIHGTALTETAGQLAAAFTKMFDVATPVLTCESVNQAQDNATVAEIQAEMEENGASLLDTLRDAVESATYGLSALETLVDDLETRVTEARMSELDPGTPGKMAAEVDLIKADAAAILLDTGTDGVVIPSAQKTGFALSATGADLILKSSTFVQAIVAAINEFATYGLTALNTLLVTTGIKAASATLANGAHGGAATVITLQTPVEVNVKKINDVSLTGDGSATPWGPA